MSNEVQSVIDNLRIEIDKHVAMPEASSGDATNNETLKQRRALQARLEIALQEQAELVEWTRVREVQRQALESGFITAPVVMRENPECKLCKLIWEPDPTRWDSRVCAACFHCNQHMCTTCTAKRKAEMKVARENRDAAKACNNKKLARKFDNEYEKLNTCPYCRKGYPTDMHTASSILRSQAKEGKVSAQSLLAKVLMDGDYGERNVREAVRWLIKAADQGDELSQSKLGHMYYSGRPDLNIPRSEEKAWKYGLPSARRGDPNGMILCALISDERGNKEDAVKWMSLGAAQQYPLCMSWMGRAHDFGEWGLERDVFKILYWYRKAALAKFGVARLSTIVRAKQTNGTLNCQLAH
jgi:TPR repeat protein